jgi:hypothetical protein
MVQADHFENILTATGNAGFHVTDGTRNLTPVVFLEDHASSANFARATKTGKTGTTSHKNKKEAAPFDRNQGSFAGKRRHTD